MKFFYDPRVYINGFLNESRVAVGAPAHQGEQYLGRRKTKATPIG